MNARFATLAFLALAPLTFAASAQAATIGSLYGSFYLDGTVALNTAAGAAAVAAAGPAAYHFNSTLVNKGTDYTGNDGTPAGSVLSNIPADQASSLPGSAAYLTVPTATAVIDLMGTLTVSQSGTYTFGDNNDDGGAFYIMGGHTPGSGTVLAENDGIHGPQSQTSTFNLTAGVPVYLEYVGYNTACFGCGFTGNLNGGGGGFQFEATITGPGDITLTALPEPSSLVLCGLGAVGLFVAARRRCRA